MKDFSQHDLISAYLDGETTPAERAEVEQWLAANPEARQLLEEFRALGSALQNLPPHTLGENLTGSILQKAERQMLYESAAIRADGKKPAEVPPWRRMLRRALTTRSLAWSGLAVAIALLLMVVERWNIDRPAGDQVAMVREEAEQKAAPKIRAARGEEKHDLARAEEEAATREAPASAPSMVAPAEEPESPPPATFAAKKMPPMRKPLGKTTPAQPQAGQPGDKAGEIANAADTAPQGAVNTKAPERSRFYAKGGRAKGAAGREIAGGTMLDQSRTAPLPGEVLLVYCDVSAQAARENQFEQVLANQGITWDKKTKADDEVLRRRLADADVFRRKSGKQFGTEPTQGDAGKPAPLDLVYVEASPEQIQATLSALKANPKVFPSVNTSTKRVGVSLEGLWSQGEQDRSPGQAAGPGGPAMRVTSQEERPKPQEKTSLQKEKTPEAKKEAQKDELRQRPAAEQGENTLPRGRAMRLQVPASGAPGLPGGEAGRPTSSARPSEPQVAQQALQSPARALFVFRLVDTPKPPTSSASEAPAKSATQGDKPE